MADIDGTAQRERGGLAAVLEERPEAKGVPRLIACRVCGLPVRRSPAAVNRDQHVACGISRGIEAARQMHEKSGPFYQRWLASAGPRGRPRQVG